MNIHKVNDFKDTINQVNELLGLQTVNYATINDAYNGMVSMVEVLREYIDEPIPGTT